MMDEAPRPEPTFAPREPANAEAQRPPSPPTIFERAKMAPVTYGICTLNVLVFLYMESHGGTTNAFNLVRFGALERSHVWAGEYFRFVTPMFIHIGWIHMLWNTYYLAGWCSAVERVLGRARFVFVYLATGMGACAVSLLGHDAPGSAGASGAAFGIVAMTMALRWKMLGSWAAFSADPWVRRLGGTLALWMVLGTFMNFDNYAHGGGFATGALLGAVLLGGKMSLSARRAALGAFVVALALLLASAAHRWQGETSVWEGARASSGRGI